MVGKEKDSIPTAAARAVCCLVLSSMLASSCASTLHRTELLTSVSEADRQRCEEFAQGEVDVVKDERVSKAFGEVFGFAILGPASVPFIALGIPFIIAEVNNASKARSSIYDRAIKECLEPVVLEANLGPAHPDLARSLRVLANRYSATEKYSHAEPLFQRALTIQEKVLGPEDPELANTVEAYSTVLTRMGRHCEADALTTRFLAIRIMHREKQQDGVSNETVR